jgi:hypothetical protein
MLVALVLVASAQKQAPKAPSERQTGARPLLNVGKAAHELLLRLQIDYNCMPSII